MEEKYSCAVEQDEEHKAYPRICAHRGFNTIAPENSMPAFGAAIALGADEIEFDIWATKDGQLVSIHDSTLNRVSDGDGNVWDYTLDELKKLDFGSKKNEHFKGLQIVLFEDILKKFARKVIMNIHVKIWDKPRKNDNPPAPMFEEISALIHKYGCEKYCYVMSSNDMRMEEFHKIAPDINRTVGFDRTYDDYYRIVNRAIKLGCNKVQLFKPYFDKDTIEYAHKNGILCNIFWSDDPEEACKFIDWGADCILTNDYFVVAEAIKKNLNKI